VGDGHAVPGQPDFSPDSAAVVVSVLSGNSQSLQVLPTVGGPPVVEVPNAMNGVWLDRSTLLFARVLDGRSSVWSVDLESGNERQIIDSRNGVSWWEIYPRPGGGFALLGGATDMSPGIFVSDGDGEEIEEWLAPGRNVKGVAWTPSGDALVASIAGQLVRLAGAGPRPVLPLHQKALRFPVFSDEGRLAATHSWQSYDIQSVDPDGGPPECLVCDQPKVGWGTAGPGGAVVYLQRRADDPRVFVRDPDGSRRALTDRSESASCPVVAPDGSRVAYLARIDGTTELRVRPYSGGEPVVLADSVERSEFVSWSPDGGSIAFAAGSPLRVWVVSTAGGEPTAVSGPGGDYPSWSPDGRNISYAIWTEATDPDQGTWIVDSDGSNPRQVGELPTRSVWDPTTGRLLQLRRATVDHTLELWELGPEMSDWTLRSALDLGGAPAIQMEFRPFTVDPESGRLIMNQLRVTSQLVVFDGVDVDRW
jgi:Tol biopolymer transport system component